MFDAWRNELRIYIMTPKIRLVECYYIAFPRFEGKYCTYSTLVQEQRQRLDAALETAQEIAERFNNDGRFEATEKEILKAFYRTFALHDYWQEP